jgi:4,5-DOPA dioxygenase extradiol
LRQLGRQLPRPKVVLVVSAHWFFGATAVTAMPRPTRDPRLLWISAVSVRVSVSGSGSARHCQEIIEAVKPTWCGLDFDQWGLDHGTWSVLAHMYPQADVPVVQLSINALKPLQYHLELGRSLASLRERGVMVIASGNVVHNLRRLQWNRPDAAFDWAVRFERCGGSAVWEAPGDVLRLVEHTEYDMAVPTPDHFIPLLYVAGIASKDSVPLKPLIRGYSMGSISMTCYGVARARTAPRGTLLQSVPSAVARSLDVLP